jgi:hypothetical protein
MPATLLQFARDMSRLGLAYHFKDDDTGYDIYWSGRVVYTLPSRTVWREWNGEVLAEVMAAVSMYEVFG